MHDHPSVAMPTPARDAVELLCTAAELSLARGAHDSAREHAQEAARLARRTVDGDWEVAVLLRASEVLDCVGEPGQAIALHCRALNLITQEHMHVAPPPGALAPTLFASLS
jgi:ATP/maltotriose-dependent transcriptional regulator MalT